ncbi:thioredoxin family protein [Flavobacterium sp. DG1-102-2]|uniref:thioredoxin family protein n=1 Tax=Flavobacterium sp. DG1-102-2 TaxID=3081663 RepID=UPI00294A5FD7|nr:thioredoxin family protein [Flavobacterium sp. DG1-102-2]MDV6168865.1 thioredoxin family protein [Flavobacterium sp. DG1-102-2]
MKKLFFTSILLTTVCFGYAQKNYVVSFTELPQKMAKEPRPVIIKMHTNWCGVCRLQDRQVEKDKDLQKLLANSYYYIEFNAESQEKIVFNGKEYSFIPNGTGGINGLATALTDTKSSYPEWVFLSADYKVISHYNGLLKSNDLIGLLSP